MFTKLKIGYLRWKINDVFINYTLKISYDTSKKYTRIKYTHKKFILYIYFDLIASLRPSLVTLR